MEPVDCSIDAPVVEDDADVDSLEEAAGDGSVSHQVALGSHLLRVAQTSDTEEGDELAQRAVKWLLLASCQGDTDAKEKLTYCLNNNIGITAGNIDRVAENLSKTEMETQAQVAARKMYRSLATSSPGGITKEDYLKKVEEVGENRQEVRILQGAVRKAKDDVSEDFFLDKMLRRVTGAGGISVPSFTSSDAEEAAFSNANLLTKVRHYPGLLVATSVTKVVDVTGQQGLSWVRSLIPTRQVYTLILVYLYTLLTSRAILWFIHIFVFYLSIATMSTVTLQMLYMKRKLMNIRIITRLLKRFNNRLDDDKTASAYQFRNLTAYWIYFAALVVMVMTFALADKNMIPCSELTILSVVFAAMAFYALSEDYDHITLLAIGLNLLSTLSVLLAGFPRIPVIYHLVVLISSPLVSIQLAPGLDLQLGVPSLAYVLMPYLFWRMAMQKSWAGTYRVLIPHLVCFFWWQVSVMFYLHSTWMGVLRASVGWLTLALMLPFLAVFLVFWVLYYLSCVATLSNLLKVVTSLLLVAVPTVLALWSKSGFRWGRFSLQGGGWHGKVLLLLLFVFSAVPLAYVIQKPEREVGGRFVTWDQFRRHCSKPQWDKTNMADATIKCSHFSNLMVQWSGPVSRIAVQRIDNQAEAFISYFPWSIANWLSCTYGEPYPDCDEIEDADDKQRCEISTMQNTGRCHLKNLNRYTFDIWVAMEIDEENVHDIKVEAMYIFEEALRKINHGDVITFRALLQRDLGNRWPVLRLYHITCDSCAHNVTHGSALFSAETMSIWDYAVQAFVQAWNFFFAPFIEFHQPVEQPQAEST